MKLLVKALGMIALSLLLGFGLGAVLVFMTCFSHSVLLHGGLW